MSPIEGSRRRSDLELAAGPAQLVTDRPPSKPHIVGSGLAKCLGIDEGQIRVVSPDVGGGFGYKGILLPEEVALAWATRKVEHPLRWLEDRRENLTANADCREHHYILTAYADADGRLLALDCEATVDSGAYSAYPFSACLEGGQIGSILPGPLRLPALPLPRLFGCHQQAADPALPRRRPHRRVLRAGGDARTRLARKVGVEANDLRMKSLVRPRADAVRQHRQTPLRLRRLSGGAAPRHRRHRLRPRA
jgi:carbon-monoxide dehydrogenase large subunit